MSDISVKNAKKTYIETGRLNRNIIDKEVAISWYKCKLQNMFPNDQFKKINEEIKNPFDSKFIKYIDSIVSDQYQFVIANKNLQVCASRIIDDNLSEMQTIDDLSIGTNGGYITQKIRYSHQVIYEEHYLDELCPYCTCGIVLMDHSNYYGTLLLISRARIEDYEVLKINEQLKKYYNREEFDVLDEQPLDTFKNEASLSEFLAYPNLFFNEFTTKIGKIIKMRLPIVIKGDRGTGKSSLATYFLLNSNESHTVINLAYSNKNIQKQLINDALFHNETVVIDDLERISEDAIQLLTLYTESILNKNIQEKYSNYKCSMLFLATVNNNLNDHKLQAENRQLIKLLDKLTMSTVNLVNSTQFGNDIDEVIAKIAIRYPFEMSFNFKQQVKKDLLTTNYKNTIENIEISMNNISNIESKLLLFHVNDLKFIPKTLEEAEYEHIDKVYKMMDLNIAATADVLKIGRTTLYRKLEKMNLFQNETKKEDKS
ncbi:helix-turn-helix domain-containing protein [Fusibacter bizertensis]